MKRLCCLFLALTFWLTFCGCQKDETLPEESSGKWEVISMEQVDYISGEIIELQAPDVLVLKLSSPKYEWGDTIYVLTEDAEKWCVGDDVTVQYSRTQYLSNDSDAKRIIADWVAAPDYCAKPILYFYPQASIVCSAKLSFDGELTCTYPSHGTDGWQNFIANPDGTLVFPDGKSYYALYWEGIQNTEWDFSKGFCVRGEDTVEFLEWALAAQGLTPREANEFIIYWLPMMQENSYNVISFQSTAYTDGAVLEIVPKPDSLLRVFMTFYATDSEVEIAPQEFQGFTRNGFTVVEWGGSCVQNPKR